MFDFIHVNIADILDVFFVAVLIYQMFRLMRRTNATSIFLGLLTLYLLYVVVKLLDMQLLSFIMGQILGVGVIAMVIVFQPEIRKFLFILGGRYSKYRDTSLGRIIFGKSSNSASRDWVEEVVRACVDMSLAKTGALIVVARREDMEEFTAQGEIVDARVKATLLETIFFKNSPLHDGAVIIENGKIHAARCILPVSRKDIPVYYGTRHRAAIGISDVSDSFVIVVSEERGRISFADKGEIVSGLNGSQLRDRIESALAR